MKKVKNKGTGCLDSCSFFVDYYDFSTIPRDEQISISKKSTESKMDLNSDASYLMRLLRESRQSRCVGGQISNNVLLKRCRYFTQVSPDIDQNSLTSLFIAKFSSYKALPWKILTVVLSVISLTLGYFVGEDDPANSKLNKPLDEVVKLDTTLINKQVEK
ncbi:MAG: hypothetical protein HQ568_10910 [Calditrichaeota bacterium]|nr:hypothetical protein [Calditrichota bacterium]